MGVRKDSERLRAKAMYVEQLKTAKEIAIVVKVNVNTVGEWIAKGNWKAERDAKFNGIPSQIKDLKELISVLTEQRLKLVKLIDNAITKKDTVAEAEYKREAVKLADEVSKWNKSLENLEKKGKISLATYIEVMESIFKDMSQKHHKIYIQLLDFQEQHIRNISLKY